MESNHNIETIRNILPIIIPTLEKESDNNKIDDFSYPQQRAMINQIFDMTSGANYNVPSIMLRLTVIDSLYSTNAQYSYFSIEEMAKNIHAIGGEEDAVQYFYTLVNRQDGKLGEDKKNLFSNTYGIRKNCEVGSKQISLMSKYAYYVLIKNPEKHPLGFPIYDSLAIEMYPLVCRRIELKPKSKLYISDSIEKYIEALDEVRNTIFCGERDLNGFQQYDLLDAYLWRMGKLNNGNYSLLLTRAEYEQFIQNLGICHAKGEVDFEKMLYEEFRDAKWKGKNLINYEDKNGKPKYSYDFNSIVRFQCANLEIGNIVKDIPNSECIKQLIKHWKGLYVEEEQSNINRTK